MGGGSGNTAWKRYHYAKLANSAFAMALHDSLKGKDSKVKSIGCEPGYSTSGLQNTSQNTGRMMLLMLNAAVAFGAAQGVLFSTLITNRRASIDTHSSARHWTPTTIIYSVAVTNT